MTGEVQDLGMIDAAKVEALAGFGLSAADIAQVLDDQFGAETIGLNPARLRQVRRGDALARAAVLTGRADARSHGYGHRHDERTRCSSDQEHYSPSRPVRGRTKQQRQ